MVRLYTSLLALTFATGLVLASSDDYQRRDYDLELLERDIDTFEEPEARSLFSGLLKVGEEVGKKAFKSGAGKVAKTAVKAENRRGSTRKLSPSRRVIRQLKPSRKTMVKQMKRAVKQANKNNDNRNNGNQNRINQDLKRARMEVADADRYLPKNLQYHVQARGLEDDEEFSGRDLDAEEVFGRENDLLDERDTFDDLD